MNTSICPKAEAMHAPVVPNTGMRRGVRTTHAIAPNIVVFMTKEVCIVVE